MAEDNIDEIVKQMSPREKAMLLVGCESLVSKDSLTVYVPGAAGYTKAFPQYGIPSTVMADGPVGVRIFPIKVDGTPDFAYMESYIQKTRTIAMERISILQSL